MAHAQVYYAPGRWMGQSPYLQELMIYAGHLDVYERGSEIIEKLLRVSSSSTTIYRLSDDYGQQLQRLLYQPGARVDLGEDEVVYAEIDGSMIYTDKKWREVKLGRIFRSDHISQSPTARRGQSIEHSEYTAHLGGFEEFTRKFSAGVEPYAHLNERLVFINDGARWIEQWITEQYPQATQILDFYHAVEHIGDFAHSAIGESDERQRWIAEQKARLLAGRVETVISAIAKQRRVSTSDVKEQADRVMGYFRTNAERMRYDEYIKRGLYIGSGAIESAHRTVVQRRMKLSGQRWTTLGAEHMLNLRACSLSGNWSMIVDLIKSTTVAA